MRLAGKVVAAACVALAVGVSTGARAQAFPSKPLRMVVPFPAGGTGRSAHRSTAMRERCSSQDSPGKTRRKSVVERAFDCCEGVELLQVFHN